MSRISHNSLEIISFFAYFPLPFPFFYQHDISLISVVIARILLLTWHDLEKLLHHYSFDLMEYFKPELNVWKTAGKLIFHLQNSFV